jgi:hypothetical protein
LVSIVSIPGEVLDISDTAQIVCLPWISLNQIKEITGQRLTLHEFYEDWFPNDKRASQSFSKITDSRYKDFTLSYEAALANYLKIQNPPSYYRDGLVSLSLLKN